jgi:hypothetical protein
MTNRLTPPTTIRLTPSLADSLRRAAEDGRTSRSEQLRRLLGEGIIARALKALPAKSSLTPVVTSTATGRAHRVKIALDVVDDDAPERVKEMVATRNSAVLSARCQCGAVLEVVDEPVPTTTRKVAVASTSKGAPSTGRATTILAKVRPSTSPPPLTESAPIRRASIEGVFRHQPDCPGAPTRRAK